MEAPVAENGTLSKRQPQLPIIAGPVSILIELVRHVPSNYAIGPGNLRRGNSREEAEGRLIRVEQKWDSRSCALRRQAKRGGERRESLRLIAQARYLNWSKTETAQERGESTRPSTHCTNGAVISTCSTTQNVFGGRINGGPSLSSSPSCSSATAAVACAFIELCLKEAGEETACCCCCRVCSSARGEEERGG